MFSPVNIYIILLCNLSWAIDTALFLFAKATQWSRSNSLLNRLLRSRWNHKLAKSAGYSSQWKPTRDLAREYRWQTKRVAGTLIKVYGYVITGQIYLLGNKRNTNDAKHVITSQEYELTAIYWEPWTWIMSNYNLNMVQIRYEIAHTNDKWVFTSAPTRFSICMVCIESAWGNLYKQNHGKPSKTFPELSNQV